MDAVREVQDKIISFDHLAQIRQKHKANRIVFCAACFDVFHVGHAVFLSQCKAYGDILVAGVALDSTIRKLKGSKRPINSQMNRLFVVAATQAVDYALFTEELEDNSDVKGILERLRPDIFCITETDEMAVEAETARCQSLGIEMVKLPRIVPEGLSRTSTTNIINTIIQNYSTLSP